MERRRPLPYQAFVQIRNRTRINDRKEADRQQLLNKRTELKDFHKIVKWLPEGLSAAMLLTMATGVAIVASGEQYAGAAVVAEGAVLAISSMASVLVRDHVTASLDQVQKLLQVRHGVHPDEGYFRRTEFSRYTPR